MRSRLDEAFSRLTPQGGCAGSREDEKAWHASLALHLVTRARVTRTAKAPPRMADFGRAGIANYVVGKLVNYGKVTGYLS